MYTKIMSSGTTAEYFELSYNNYGFRWGNVLIQRTASMNDKKRKWQVISVYAPNGEIIEIKMTPRKIFIERIPKYKEDKSHRRS